MCYILRGRSEGNGRGSVARRRGSRRRHRRGRGAYGSSRARDCAWQDARGGGGGRGAYGSSRAGRVQRQLRFTGQPYLTSVRARRRCTACPRGVRGVCIRTSGSQSPVNTREDSLRDRPLQVARQSGPSSATVGAELAAQTFRRESEQLGQHLRAFDVDRAKGLEHHRSKQVRLTLETEVILLVFALLGILFAGLDHSNIRLRQGTGNRNINRQTFAFLPDRNRHIARASARGGAKNTLLLHDRTQQAIRSHRINQISHILL